MRFKIWAALVVSLLAVDALAAQPPLAIRNIQEGRMRLTYLEPAPAAPAGGVCCPPKAAGRVVQGQPAATEPGKAVVAAVADAAKIVAPEQTTLAIADWRTGRSFTDEAKRRWCLVNGVAVADTPARLRGWLLKTSGNRLFFLSEDGRLYGQIS